MRSFPKGGRLLGVLLAFFLLGPGLAVAGWEHQVRILTDTPNAWVYVEGKKVAPLDNSTFSSEEEKWYDESRTKGGYGAYIDLQDFEKHKIQVGTSPSVLSSGFVMFAMPDTPTLSRFVPLGDSSQPPLPRRICPQCVSTIPSGETFCPQCGYPGGGGPEIPWWQAALNWVSTPVVAVLLILGVAFCLAAALIVAFFRRGDSGTKTNPVHVPTIIGHGWPYVMFEKCPSIIPIEKIGAGGVASVFLAHAPKKGQVAIKILHEHQSNDPDLRQRFLQEARVLRKLATTGVVPLAYDMSRKDFPRPWFTMSYLGQMYRAARHDRRQGPQKTLPRLGLSGGCCPLCERGGHPSSGRRAP